MGMIETRTVFVLQLKEMDKARWVDLFAFIPRIEGKTSFGRVIEPPPRDGIKQSAFYVPDVVVIDFVDFLHQHEMIVNFDWRAWNDYPDVLSNPDFDFNNLDIYELFLVLTVMVRNDRFTEGFLIKCFEDQVVLRVLRVIKSLIDSVYTL